MFRSATDAHHLIDVDRIKLLQIGPATDPRRLTEEFLQRAGGHHTLPRLGAREHVEHVMTVRDFVEHVFVPEHVVTKTRAGRIHYQAILKHVLTPEEVDRMFQVDAGAPNRKLKAVPNWPYLGNLRLCDARPDDVQRLISAALADGYSTETARHIRSVVSTIFTHARKKRWFTGDNPADPVKLPGPIRKEALGLTLSQAKQVLAALQYPEKELALIAILTGMKVPEICGLQWKHVNLTETWSDSDGEPIPPRTIRVRQQWCRGKLCAVNGKIRDLPIPHLAFPLLFDLTRRGRYNSPSDFVLASRTGMPVDWKGSAARRLKPTGRDLQMPWLCWRVFSRTRTNWLNDLGTQFHELLVGQHSESSFPSGQPTKRRLAESKREGTHGAIARLLARLKQKFSKF